MVELLSKGTSLQLKEYFARIEEFFAELFWTDQMYQKKTEGKQSL